MLLVDFPASYLNSKATPFASGRNSVRRSWKRRPYSSEKFLPKRIEPTMGSACSRSDAALAVEDGRNGRRRDPTDLRNDAPSAAAGFASSNNFGSKSAATANLQNARTDYAGSRTNNGVRSDAFPTIPSRSSSNASLTKSTAVSDRGNTVLEMASRGRTNGSRRSPRVRSGERSMKAAILIQSWYRRYKAKIELKRMYTWQIFQTLEYAGEHDQLKLHEFFAALLDHVNDLKTRQNTGSDDVSTAGNGFTSNDEEADGNARGQHQRQEEPAQQLFGARKGSIAVINDIMAMSIEEDYDGPRLTFPLEQEDLSTLIIAFRLGKRLHVHHVCRLVMEAVDVLRKQPTLRAMSTKRSRQVTVCGDIHGQLDDLLTIFQRNGLPSPQNPYVFNGDYVDRGPYSMEVLLLLLACLLVYPEHVFLNRGNHEDLVMNARYGFLQEIHSKYRSCASAVLRVVEEAYRWLPLGTVIDGKVVVVHGGVSESTDLKRIYSLAREKYTSILRPPIPSWSASRPGYNIGNSLVDSYEWRQVMDLLWSDPKRRDGCGPNEYRGGGSYFGPDVTAAVLERHGLRLLIRSHECKPNGYAFCHNDKCLTVFSASNYYEVGSNKGAFVQLHGSHLRLRFVQFAVAHPLVVAPPAEVPQDPLYKPTSGSAAAAVDDDGGRTRQRQNETVTVGQQVGKVSENAGRAASRRPPPADEASASRTAAAVAAAGRRTASVHARKRSCGTLRMAETSAMKELKLKMKEHAAEIADLCQQYDVENTGRLSLTLWCKAMEKGTGLSLPWRMLRPKFVPLDSAGLVVYNALQLDDGNDDKFFFSGSKGGVVEALIRNRASLETIFKIIDSDNSGEITMDQFATACALLSEYLPNPISPEAMNNLARSIDINGDGIITLGEFLEAFQKVDEALSNKRAEESQQHQQPTEISSGGGRDDASSAENSRQTRRTENDDNKETTERSRGDGVDEDGSPEKVSPHSSGREERETSRNETRENEPSVKISKKIASKSYGRESDD